MLKLNTTYLYDTAQRALAQYGAAEIAANLADVWGVRGERGCAACQQAGEQSIGVPPAGCTCVRAEAEKFVKLYGPLVPFDIDQRIGMLTPWTNDRAADQVLAVSNFFRMIWKTERTQENIWMINSNLDSIFNYVRGYKPGGAALMEPDFATGEFIPVPQTLLEVLAIELMHSRNRLTYCGRPECGRHLIQQYSRHKYCSAFCSEDMRARKLKEWHEGKKNEAKKDKKKARKR